MRLAGTIAERGEAETFVAHLLTLEVESQLRENDSGVGVWIYDEGHLDVARRELERFLREPLAPRYAAALRAATTIREHRAREATQRAHREVDLRKRWRAPNWQDLPITIGCVLVSVLVAMVTRLGQGDSELLDLLRYSNYRLTEGAGWRLPPEITGGVRGVGGGQLWRLVSPIFLHFALLHVFMNLFVFFHLGTVIEARRGSLRFAGLILLIALPSNFLQFCIEGPSFGGLSGVVFGLVGYSWAKTRYQPRLGIAINPRFVSFLMFWLVLCFFLPMPIANTAHVAGLLAGVGLGILPARSVV